MAIVAAAVAVAMINKEGGKNVSHPALPSDERHGMLGACLRSSASHDGDGAQKI